MNPIPVQSPYREQESFSELLKAATADSHAALEKTPLSLKLLQPGLSVTHYREYLEKMYALNLFTEEKVAPSIAVHLPDMANRTKISWLQHDLQWLNAPLPAASVYAEVDFVNTAERMGWYYVVEGSTLGGRVILKALRLNLPTEVFENATRFFNGYEENTGKYWKEFLTQLEQFAKTPAARKNVIDGANKAFKQIEKAFNS